MEVRCECGGEALVQMVIGCRSHVAHDYRFCLRCSQIATHSGEYRHPECGTTHVLDDFERRARFL